jgi:hypothetical protein
MTRRMELDEGRWVLRQSINDRFDRPDKHDERDGISDEPICKSVVSGLSDYGPAPDPNLNRAIEARICRELLEAEKACGGPL